MSTSAWSQQCVVCLTNPSNMKFNCDHLVVCSECDERLEKCPICRCVIIEREIVENTNSHTEEQEEQEEISTPDNFIVEIQEEQEEIVTPDNFIVEFQEQESVREVTSNQSVGPPKKSLLKRMTKKMGKMLKKTKKVIFSKESKQFMQSVGEGIIIIVVASSATAIAAAIAAAIAGIVIGGFVIITLASGIVKLVESYKK